jgi:hypothetical protein
MSKLVGTNEPQFNLVRLTWSPQSSGEYQGRIEGPAEQVKAYMPQLMAEGAEFTFTQDKSPNASIDFRFARFDHLNNSIAQPEQPTLQHEFLGNFNEKDYLEADIAAVNALTANDKTLLRKRLNGTDLNSTEIASLSGSGALIHSDVIEGQRTVLVTQPVIRISKSVSNTYQVKTANTNVKRIFSTATLSMQENIPVSILFDLDG